MKTLSLNTVGSRLYGLHNERSDYDLVMVYRRNVLDYLTLGNYEDHLPDQTLAEGQFVLNYKYWDIKRVLRYVSQSNWQAFEIVMSNKTHCQSAEAEMFYSLVTTGAFDLKSLGYYCLNVSHANTMRGYMKALKYVYMRYMLQYAMPLPTLSAFDILDMVSLDSSEKLHITELFVNKIKGIKHSDFLIEPNHKDYKVALAALPDAAKPVDCEALFKQILKPNDYS